MSTPAKRTKTKRRPDKTPSRPPAQRVRGQPQAPARSRASIIKPPPDVIGVAIRKQYRVKPASKLKPSEIAERKEVFLRELFAGEPHIVALAKAGLRWTDVSDWMCAHDQGFDAEFTDTYEKARKCQDDMRRFRLVAYADQRAMEGWDEPVWFQGHVVGYQRKFSESLMALQLKSTMPVQYADRHEHTGPGGAPMQIHVDAPPPPASIAEWERQAKAALEAEKAERDKTKPPEDPKAG